jgi:hypothetical protein
VKTYDIFSHADFDNFVEKCKNYFIKRTENGLGFQPITITSKKYRIDKTPQQLKFYWICISEAQKAFRENGHDFGKEEIHEFFKKEYGYSDIVTLKDGTTIEVTKSISHLSEDVNIEVMKGLIDFILRWVSINLNYNISDPRK